MEKLGYMCMCARRHVVGLMAESTYKEFHGRRVGTVPSPREQNSGSVLVVYGCGADTFKVKLEPRGGRPWEKFAVNLVVVQRLLQLR